MPKENLIPYHNEELVKKSLEKLNDLYFDDKVLNNVVSINEEDAPEIKKDVVSVSAKRNQFKNFTIYDSEIIGSAFSGSHFTNFTFRDCEIIGNSFVCSNFNKFNILALKKKTYKSNNFSQSYFCDCQFDNMHLSQSTWLNSRVKLSQFSNCILESCTFEGTIFRKCEFKNSLMCSANLDYMVLEDTKLDNVVLPFYQFAYIIGATNYLRHWDNLNIKFKCGEKTVTINEYVDCLLDLIHYYYEKREFFPMCNLLIGIGDLKNAKKFAIAGIEKALNEKNYRLVKHFCVLGKFNNLLDYDLISEIKDKINHFLINTKLRIEELNEALIQTAEITALINERAANRTSLQIEVETNIVRGCVDEHEKIEKLISDCIYIIDTPSLQAEGHTVTELSYCPITLLFEIIGTVANLATIGSALQEFFVRIKKDKAKNSREIANSIRKKYDKVSIVDVDTRIKLAKSEIEKSMLELKNYKGSKANEKYEDFISNITQKIIGDVDNILDKDMLVLRVES